MTELDPNQNQNQDDKMDAFLRRSLTAPVPKLPANFDQHVLGEIRRASQPSQYHRALLTGYTVISVIVCAVIMRSQGLPWTTTAAMILAPLALVAIAFSARRTKHAVAPTAGA